MNLLTSGSLFKRHPVQLWGFKKKVSLIWILKNKKGFVQRSSSHEGKLPVGFLQETRGSGETHHVM